MLPTNISLNALRAFESVMRLGRVDAAAAELRVTAGAVSQQLTKLQDAIGVRLFVRCGRGLQPTVDGESLNRAIGQSFSIIDKSIRSLAGTDQRPRVNIAAPPLLTAFWISGRMVHYNRAEVQEYLSINCVADFELVDWREIDIAILHGTPPWQGFWWTKLCELLVQPAVPPGLLDGLSISEISDQIVHGTLLHEDDGAEWRRWLDARGLVHAGTDMYVGNISAAMECAIDGLGFAMVDDLIGERLFRSGRLKRVHEMAIAASSSFFVACPEKKAADQSVRRIIRWLVNEAGQSVGRPANHAVFD
jgi:LysR family transcriptional regulator, glycine cleavage system transcriptional activator